MHWHNWFKIHTKTDKTNELVIGETNWLLASLDHRPSTILPGAVLSKKKKENILPVSLYHVYYPMCNENQWIKNNEWKVAFFWFLPVVNAHAHAKCNTCKTFTRVRHPLCIVRSRFEKNNNKWNKYNNNWKQGISHHALLPAGGQPCTRCASRTSPGSGQRPLAGGWGSAGEGRWTHSTAHWPSRQSPATRLLWPNGWDMKRYKIL